MVSWIGTCLQVAEGQGRAAPLTAALFGWAQGPLCQTGPREASECFQQQIAPIWEFISVMPQI